MSEQFTATDGGVSGPHVRVKLTKNTKGYSWETSCTLALAPGENPLLAIQRAIDVVAAANADLKDHYGSDE